jgi:hypothetical protein
VLRRAIQGMTSKERGYARELAEAVGLGEFENLPLDVLVSAARHQLESLSAQHSLDRASIAFAHERCDRTLRRQHVRRRRCMARPIGGAA